MSDNFQIPTVNEPKFPVKYVLYSHYSAEEPKDFAHYTTQDKLLNFAKDKEAEAKCVLSLSGVRHLEKHFRALRELLTAPGHEGLLVLFYAPGFEEFLEGLADHENEQQLLERSSAIFHPFEKEDIDLSAFVAQLRTGNPPLCKFLLTSFPESLRQRLIAFSGHDERNSLLKAIVEELNHIIRKEGSIYDESLFFGVTLRQETKLRREQAGFAGDHSHPNRLLLEDAFPGIIARNSPPLRFAQAFADCIRQRLIAEGLDDRVRILTSLDLLVILGRVNTIVAAMFQNYIVGQTHGIRYDTPKIPEAVLRLRLLGHGIPVLRVDHDVIFREANKSIGDLGLFKAIACSKLAYHLRLGDPTVSTFLFSASYNTRSLADTPPDMDKFEAWSRAFATRVHPALWVDLPEITQIAKRCSKFEPVEFREPFTTRDLIASISLDGIVVPMSSSDIESLNLILEGSNLRSRFPEVPLCEQAMELLSHMAPLSSKECIDLNRLILEAAYPVKCPKKDARWDNYVRDHLDEPLARRFFGLKDTGLEADGVNGLTAIGAHPRFAVISGALLCISEGAILDLPPFSNFRHNVMWIDDHLKYSLHREMRHFTSAEELDLGATGLSQARLDEVMVTKARPAVNNLVGYTLGSYLPTLFLGAIMDAWINPAPILKCRYMELCASEKDAWKTARNSRRGILPEAMMEALRAGDFPPGAKRALRHALELRAVVRINELREQWMKLRDASDSKKRTFASYWASGEVEKHFPASCFEGEQFKDGMWKGISSASSITSLDELHAQIMHKVRDLIQDALDYVDWTREWPKFVQIVRSIEQGTFHADMRSFARRIM